MIADKIISGWDNTDKYKIQKRKYPVILSKIILL